MIVHAVTQNTPEWFAIRRGMPTTSMAASLVTSTGMPSDGMKDYAIQLAMEKHSDEACKFKGNKHTDRGHELEPVACADYQMTYGVEVRHVGIITDDLQLYGSSIDGLVGDTGGLEIKCLSWKEHYKVMSYYKTHDRAPSTYIPQTQGELFVCELDYVDLYYWHPELPAVCIRQYPDKKIVTMLKRQLRAVLAERNVILETIENYYD